MRSTACATERTGRMKGIPAVASASVSGLQTTNPRAPNRPAASTSRRRSPIHHERARSTPCSRAAREHGLDLARSWWIGDRRRDVEAAGRFGARGFVVCSPETEAEATAGMPFIHPVRSVAQAVDLILAENES